MKKIPTMFVRDFDNRPAHVLPEVTPGCDWVLAGEGQATRKYDGTCVMLDEAGKWWARREVKPGKTPPPNYVVISTDEETAKTVGWEPIDQSSFAKFHAEAVQNHGPSDGITGTYELIGPKINGNPEHSKVHLLVEHADAQNVVVPELTFEGIRSTVLALAASERCEGIVWHHPDGRMAKIKARDFAPKPS
ncbi:RNA ligase 1 family protein [Streptomyces atratus]|uniref:RNA ligase 1 family protein n=1 Tax=Streptomyces atratus TaxID=1893 RepID=UPI0033C4EA61